MTSMVQHLAKLINLFQRVRVEIECLLEEQVLEEYLKVVREDALLEWNKEKNKDFPVPNSQKEKKKI